MLARSVSEAEDFYLASGCRDGIEGSEALLDKSVLGCVAGFGVPAQPCVAVGDGADGVAGDVVEKFFLTCRERNCRDGSSDCWLREMLRRPVVLDFSVEDGEILDRLRVEREEDRAVKAHRQARDAAPDGEFREPPGFDLKELTGELHVLGVVAAEDEFEAAVRDEAFAHVGLLRCRDDCFAVLAYLAGESCRYADFAQAFTWEDVVSFVEHEEVLELLACGE